MEEYTDFTSSQINNHDAESTSVSLGINFNRSADTEGPLYTKNMEKAKIIVLTTFPVILVAGTIGNLLTFIVMQRGSLRHSSTCFYMAMLAVADTCKYSIVEQRGALKHLSTYFYMAMLAVADTCKYFM